MSSASTVLLGAAVLVVAMLCATLGAAQDIPKSVDWREKGVVGPVLNQGQCGDDFLFATVDNIASVSAIANGGKYVRLSVAELITCEAAGCNGGLANDAYKWILAHGGKIAPASYNISNKIQCKDVEKLPVGAKISGVLRLPHSEKELMRSVALRGPVFVTVDANSWATYGGGVLEICSKQTIDHAVVVVGYNVEKAPGYWIVKNSWGTSWGENGYIRIAFGSDLCGIASNPLTVVAEKLE